MVQDMACRCMSRIFHDLFLVILCWFTRKLHWEERWKCGTLKCLVSSSKIWNMSILTRNWWAHGQATTISGGVQMSEALCVWNPYPENGIYHCILLPNKTSTKQMLGFDLENLNEFARRLETSRWPLQHSVGRPPARFETSDFVEIRQDFFHFTIQVSCEIFPAQQLCNSGWGVLCSWVTFRRKNTRCPSQQTIWLFQEEHAKINSLRSRTHLGNIHRVSSSHDINAV